MLLRQIAKLIEDGDTPEDSDFPKLISKGGEFRVELDEEEQVSILDGKDNIRLKMPLIIWKQLTR